LEAFPKYSVSFLNDFPVANETAQHWLQHGLRGGELEFLDDQWDTLKHIDSGEGVEEVRAILLSNKFAQLPTSHNRKYITSALALPIHTFV
jgi:hypothetical protein